MPKSKQLHQQIERKLTKLHECLDKVDEVRAVNPDDPETWDSDSLYNLVENLKAALKILADQPIKGQDDELGPLLYEDGLCSLVESYHSEE